MRDGLRYSYQFRPVRAVLTLLSVVSLTGLSFQVLMPVVATEQIGGTVRTYGFLSAATGVGALLSAIMLASRATVV